MINMIRDAALDQLRDDLAEQLADDAQESRIEAGRMIMGALQLAYFEGHGVVAHISYGKPELVNLFNECLSLYLISTQEKEHVPQWQI